MVDMVNSIIPKSNMLLFSSEIDHHREIKILKEMNETLHSIDWSLCFAWIVAILWFMFHGK